MDLNQDNISHAKEGGSSLVAVLVIITILLFLIGSVMLGIIMQGRFIQRDIDQVQARYAAEAGIHHFLADTSRPVLSESDSLKIQLIDSSTATIKAKPFGGFLSVTSTSTYGSQSASIRVLAGSLPTSLFEQAVVLGDRYSALNLTGTTEIEGDITVGPLGIKKSSFKGKTFKGSVNGDIHKSNSELLPKFDKSLFEEELTYCEALLQKPPLKAVTIKPGKIDESNKAVFKDGSILFVDGDLRISGNSEISLPAEATLIVTGNLTLEDSIAFQPFTRFIAGKQMKISGSTKGMHGLFYAGQEITINGQLPFSGQFITGQKATISGSSYLRYPSVVYSDGNVEQGIREGRVELSGNSIIEGTVVIPAPDKIINDDKLRLVIGNGATVRGGIFNTGQTELHGEVLGSVLTLQFYFYKSPTSYINWLKDVSIKEKARPENYAIPLGFSENRKFKILAWEETS